MSTEIYLFTDYRDQFYSSTKYRGAAVNLDQLQVEFSNRDFKLFVLPISKIDFRTHNYKDTWVLYQSSEDPGLFYKSFIDDQITGLFMQGARLIPNIFQFKAHHNKNFMEIMRDSHVLPDVRNIRAFRYGTYEDYVKNFSIHKSNSYVLKSSSTSKSKHVYLLDNETKKKTLPKKISRSWSLKNLAYLMEMISTGLKPLPISNHRKKFILQEYIPGLQGDYRIVVYGTKYYVLYRKNRENDFRASGSMNFDFHIIPPDGILDFAKKVFDSFNVPFIALDIGVNNDEFYLFEFQFISFGQYTLEKSNFYYKLSSDTWNKVQEIPNLERELASSVVMFINNQK